MKTTITNTKYLFTLLLTTLFLAACSDVNEILDQPEQPATEGIHFTAVFGVKNATTRALSDPGNGTLTASWQIGEQIAIVFGGEKYTATVISVDDSGSATVSATLPSATPNNQAVTFVYPASAADGSGLRSDLLAEQDGSLATLSSQLDVATADGTIVIDGNTAQPNGSVSLENQYAICKLQFKDESNAAITDITEVTITDLATQEVISVTTSTPQSAVYVAMTPTNNSVKFEVKCSNGNIYKKIATSNLKAGLFYHPTLSAIFTNDLNKPLTFEAKVAGSTVTLGRDPYSEEYYLDPSINLEYSINNGEWTTYTFGNTINLEKVGDKVSFRGNNTIFNGFEDDYETYTYYALAVFSCTGQCYLMGNIMSLLYKTDYATATSLPRHNVFNSLFQSNKNIYSHPYQVLSLPATTLTDGCYGSMFAYCSSLTTVPELPATTLAQSCYASMFEGCSAMTTAPALPATLLSDNCYSSMFCDCSSLTKAPILPATTMTQKCYERMFQGCSALTAAPALPATSLADYCYTNMFAYCNRLNTAPALPATTLPIYCYQHMFDGCSALTTAPALPATTLATSCYESMFQGCSALTTAPALPATTLATSCYENMFQGCSRLTTAPALPATSLVNYCYKKMFQGCSALTTAPALPSTTLAVSCYYSMFEGCSNLTTAPALPATTLVNYCYYCMFKNCTSLTTAPVLPATTLGNNCYQGMFYGCSSLNSVTCLATTGIYTNTMGRFNLPTWQWLHGVAATGTFTKAKDAVWPTNIFFTENNGESGIPSGWTVVDAQ